MFSVGYPVVPVETPFHRFVIRVNFGQMPVILVVRSIVKDVNFFDLW